MPLNSALRYKENGGLSCCHSFRADDDDKFEDIKTIINIIVYNLNTINIVVIIVNYSEYTIWY